MEVTAVAATVGAARGEDRWFGRRGGPNGDGTGRPGGEQESEKGKDTWQTWHGGSGIGRHRLAQTHVRKWHKYQPIVQALKRHYGSYGW